MEYISVKKWAQLHGVDIRFRTATVTGPASMVIYWTHASRHRTASSSYSGNSESHSKIDVDIVDFIRRDIGHD